VANAPKSKTTFNFRVDRWDSAGESTFEHVGGSDDFLCAVKWVARRANSDLRFID
jgi:hypothetical protein